MTYYNKIIKKIKEIIINRELYTENFESEVGSMESFLGDNKLTELITIDNDSSIGIINCLSLLDDEIETEFKKMITTDGNLKLIVVIVNNLADKVRLEKELLEKIKKIKSSVKINVKDIFFVISNEIAKKEIILKGLHRFEFIHMPRIEDQYNSQSDGKDLLKGFVTTVKLIELVELYNIIGDDLFKRNLRYGLKDELGVDTAIYNTLRDEPYKFWFRNNGITIITENSNFKLDRVSEVCLDTVTDDEEIRFSVVNGAQTIIAASNFFYNPSEDEKIKNNARDKAKVLLRVINIPDDLESSTKEANEISVALNRQKPIKIEDIAFTTSFVIKLSNFLEYNNPEIESTKFKLEKRQANLPSSNMSLVDFARAQKACIKKPGDARSSSSATLLGVSISNKGDLYLKSQDIFKLDNSDEMTKDHFKKRYNAVLFANELAKEYERNIKKKTQNDSEKNVILKNGKWYFVSFIINFLNKSEEDFSDLNYEDLNKIKNSMNKVIDDFVDFSYRILNKNKNESIDSNLFKKNEAFKMLLDNKDKFELQTE